MLETPHQEDEEDAAGPEDPSLHAGLFLDPDAGLFDANLTDFLATQCRGTGDDGSRLTLDEDGGGMGRRQIDHRPEHDQRQGLLSHRCSCCFWG